jgi:hypothetical protein
VLVVLLLPPVLVVLLLPPVLVVLLLPPVLVVLLPVVPKHRLCLIYSHKVCTCIRHHHGTFQYHVCNTNMPFMSHLGNVVIIHSYKKNSS